MVCTFPSAACEHLVKGETCEIFHFSTLLSSEDCSSLLALGLCYQQPAAKPQPATAVPLPADCRVLAAVETQLQAALDACTGRAGDGLELDPAIMGEDVAAALVWEEADSETLRNCNWASMGVEMKARLTAWLSPAPGGEIVFSPTTAAGQNRSRVDLTLAVNLGSCFEGVLKIRALLFAVYLRERDTCKLPSVGSQSRASKPFF